MAELGVQRLCQRHQDGGADDRPPVHADTAEQRDNQGLRGRRYAEHGLRRHHQENHGVEPACGRGHRRAQHDGAHLPAQRIDARRLGGRLVLLDGQQRHAEARPLDMQRHDHARHRQGQGQGHVDALVAELGVEGRRLAHHRQRHLLVAQPLEHEQHGERIGQHRQGEVVAPQPEGGDADDDAAQHADGHAQRDAEPGRYAEFHEGDRHGVAAKAEERGMAERDETAVARQHVPAEPHGGPQQHERHDQLVVGVAHQEAEQQVEPGEDADGEIAAAQGGTGAGHHVRSHTRPNIPCGRKKTIRRKTTKMAVFCSW